MATYTTIEHILDDCTLEEAIIALADLVSVYGKDATLRITTKEIGDDWGYTTRGSILLYYNKKKEI